MVSRRSLIIAAAAGAFAFATTSFVYQRGGAILIDLERGYEGAFVDGFHSRERAEGKYFRWTDDASYVELRHLPLKGTIGVEARLRTLRPEGTPLPSLAFISYTFFAGRYLNPILPCLAAAGGVAISAIGNRFGTAAATLFALGAGVQPLYRAVHVDRLFASEDTRTLARSWALRNLPSGSTVALQSYSVPLPQSMENFRESVEANDAVSELDRKGKYAHLLRVAEGEEKSFRLIFLGKGDELNRIYVGYDALLSGLEPLRALGVTAIILRHPPTPPPPEVEALFSRVKAEGRLLATISPYSHYRGAPTTPYLDNEDWAPSSALARKGPLIEIWSLDDR